MSKDFLILRYLVSCPFITDSVSPIYEKYYPNFKPGDRARNDPHNLILNAKEAHQLIRKLAMIKVMENEYGTIWKVPE